ncbi:glycosyltransferase family 4 protein [Pseudoalteromonas sp. SSM20]|uniref:glycosyltransferase family 4 protein n=1 Tax=Pseudoalteromonas sp. SSM20 TaxID=3139394 RepID=UPI003BAD7DAA
MKILIPSIQVPFISGGAELMTYGLKNALIENGHEVEVVTFPFKFSPLTELELLMDYCKSSLFDNFNGYNVDLVIALQFPAFYIQHPNRVLWLMHQHRSVYDLYSEQESSTELRLFRKKVHNLDSNELASYPKRFSMCQNITDRLRHYNNIDSTPVYHPPNNHTLFYNAGIENFIFCPSRLECLKRQDLLIQALVHSKSNVGVIIAGTGGQEAQFKELAESLGVAERIRFVGYISEQEKRAYYAHCLAVFFGPQDEDYGYITLEAFLSSKPVITCHDSGGPTEFVIDQRNGYIVEPKPEQIAEKIDYLVANKQHAEVMGQEGLVSYREKSITWQNVVEKLLG